MAFLGGVAGIIAGNYDPTLPIQIHRLETVDIPASQEKIQNYMNYNEAIVQARANQKRAKTLAFAGEGDLDYLNRDVRTIISKKINYPMPTPEQFNLHPVDTQRSLQFHQDTLNIQQQFRNSLRALHNQQEQALEHHIAGVFRHANPPFP
jgi:hypothetical protein